jgi:hypothetical protein
MWRPVEEQLNLMIQEARGKVEKGFLVLDSPLALPDGTEVRVRVEPVPLENAPPPQEPEEFTRLPFFGMWADREEMADSAEWVQRMRDQWKPPRGNDG